MFGMRDTGEALAGTRTNKNQSIGEIYQQITMTWIDETYKDVTDDFSKQLHFLGLGEQTFLRKSRHSMRGPERKNIYFRSPWRLELNLS